MALPLIRQTPARPPPEGYLLYASEPEYTCPLYQELENDYIKGPGNIIISELISGFEFSFLRSPFIIAAILLLI